MLSAKQYGCPPLRPKRTSAKSPKADVGWAVYRLRLNLPPIAIGRHTPKPRLPRSRKAEWAYPLLRLEDSKQAPTLRDNTYTNNAPNQ